MTCWRGCCQSERSGAEWNDVSAWQPREIPPPCDLLSRGSIAARAPISRRDDWQATCLPRWDPGLYSAPKINPLPVAKQFLLHPRHFDATVRLLFRTNDYRGRLDQTTRATCFQRVSIYACQSRVEFSTINRLAASRGRFVIRSSVRSSLYRAFLSRVRSPGSIMARTHRRNLAWSRM